MDEIMMVRFARKASNYDELVEYGNRGTCWEKCRVYRTLQFTAAKWDAFMKRLLADNDWLADFSKYCDENKLWQEVRPCIVVECAERGKKIIINTEGYNYARYAALI